MPLKLIGAGLSRTGTMSLYTALMGLDLRCYHMKEVVQNTLAGRGDLDRWRRVFALQPFSDERMALLAEIFDGYQATCDAPANYVYRELMALNPHAHVISTTRAAATWRASVAETIHHFMTVRRRPGGELAMAVHQLLYRLPGLWRFGLIGVIWDDRSMHWQPFLDDAGEVLDFQSGAAAAEIERRFEAWDHAVHAEVPPERLIALAVPYEGAYEAVCAALGEQAPERPWPHVNDRDEILAAVRAARIMFPLIPIVAVASVLGIAGAAVASGSPWLVLGIAAIGLALLIGMQKILERVVDQTGTQDRNAAT